VPADQLFSLALLDSSLDCLSQGVMATGNGDETLLLPRFPAPILIQFCDSVRELFTAEPVVLDLFSLLYIVGDLHGHVLDLIGILQKSTNIQNVQKSVIYLWPISLTAGNFQMTANHHGRVRSCVSNPGFCPRDS
jgi:hypothetical protein